MACVTAVCIDDDLSAGQAAVPDRTADDEPARRIDVVFRTLVDPLRGEDGLENLLHDRLAQHLRGHIGTVLGGQHHGFETDRPVVLVPEGDLTLRVRAQPGQLALLAHFGLPLHEAVRESDRRGHEHFRLIRGIAEHQPLIAGPLLALVLAVHPLRYVRRLLADDVDHATAGAVEAHLRGVVTDIEHHLADQGLDVDPGLGGHFTRHHDDTRLDERLASDAAPIVFLENRIQHRIRDLVGHLVRVSFGDGLGSKQKIIGHRL